MAMTNDEVQYYESDFDYDAHAATAREQWNREEERHVAKHDENDDSMTPLSQADHWNDFHTHHSEGKFVSIFDYACLEALRTDTHNRKYFPEVQTPAVSAERVPMHRPVPDWWRGRDQSVARDRVRQRQHVRADYQRMFEKMRRGG